ncbi:MAG: ribulose 1,5-bisphosphate carboxylase [Proteobacteria bacterium]|nr:ribulose 1,5-bisphosphate carboxylase [Pseudomonadota bacterium]
MALAIEQSVEMPVSAIADANVLVNVVGRVAAIEEIAIQSYEVVIDLATSSATSDAGQFLNMLFGNSSLQADIVLRDVRIPSEYAALFGGPRHGLAGLRARIGAAGRALTCSALKPQGLTPGGLADLAARLARGGIDYIKDDHGLAEQAAASFAARVAAIAGALHAVARTEGHVSRYVPNLSGSLDDMRRQIAIATDHGIDAAMIAPMIAGPANLQALARAYPGFAFLAHPALAGATRIAPALLLGKLFRLFGADATIFPNHGGRFGYSGDVCRELATAARQEWHGLRATAPVPAGGMTRDRVGEMLEFYGIDIMVLIGGGLLESGARLTQVASDFAAEVKNFTPS